jgi:hypothetical protein
VGSRASLGRGGEEKNSQPLPGLESPIIQPVAQRYTIEPSQLLPLSECVRDVLLDYWKKSRSKKEIEREAEMKCR